MEPTCPRCGLILHLDAETGEWTCIRDGGFQLRERLYLPRT
jgi:transposase